MPAQCGWPNTHRVVVFNRLCGEAVLRGADIFVRGIICADSGIRKGEDFAVSLKERLVMQQEEEIQNI